MFGVWFVLIAASVQQDFINLPLGRHMQLFDVDYERSFYTWFSQLVLAAIAFAAFHIAATSRTPSKLVRIYWFLLAGVFLALSMEEMLGFHERLDMAMRARPDAAASMGWVGPAAAFCLVGLVGAIPFLRALPKRVALQFAGCGALFVLGAVGMEIVGALIVGKDDALRYSMPFRIEANIEEALEGLGALLFLTTLVLNKARLVEAKVEPITLPWRTSPVRPADKIAA